MFPSASNRKANNNGRRQTQMKHTTRNKQGIIGPLIALLALLCGSASAESTQQINKRSLKQVVEHDIQLVIKQSQRVINQEINTVTLQPLNTLIK